MSAVVSHVMLLSVSERRDLDFQRLSVIACSRGWGLAFKGEGEKKYSPVVSLYCYCDDLHRQEMVRVEYSPSGLSNIKISRSMTGVDQY